LSPHQPATQPHNEHTKATREWKIFCTQSLLFQNRRIKLHTKLTAFVVRQGKGYNSLQLELNMNVILAIVTCFCFLLLQSLMASAFSPSGNIPKAQLDQINIARYKDVEIFSNSLASNNQPFSSLALCEKVSEATIDGSKWNYQQPSEPVSKTAGEYILLIYIGFSVLAGVKEFATRFQKWNINRSEE